MLSRSVRFLSLSMVLVTAGLLSACEPEVEESVSLQGNASLDGQEDHSGIRVHLSLDSGGLVDSALTDIQGGFVFRGVSQVDYRLTFSQKNHVTQTEIIARYNGSGFTLNDGEPIVLVPDTSASVSGSLSTSLVEFDWDGADVALKGEQSHRVEPDAEGLFTVENVVPGAYLLEVRATGHLPHVEAVVLETQEAKDLGEIKLVPEFEDPEAAVSMTGIARLNDTQNHQGILVASFIGQTPVDSTLTDEEGRYSLRASRATHSLRFIKEGYQSDDLDEVSFNEDCGCFLVDGASLSEHEGVSLVRERNARINGQLSSRGQQFTDWNDRVRVARLNLGRDQQVALDVQPQGDFSLTESVPAGVYVLELDFVGHIPTALPVIIDAGDNDLGVVELSPERDSDETSIQMQGQVCLGSCEAEERDHSGILVQAFIGNNPAGSVSTNPEGYFALRTDRANHTLVFSKPGSLSITGIEVVWDEIDERFEYLTEDLGEDVVFELQPDLSASLSGALTTPLEGFDWDLAQVTLRGPGTTRTINPLGDGTFTFDRLQIGLYGLEINTAGHLFTSRIVDVQAGENALEEPIALTPEFEVPEQAAIMTGRVTLENEVHHLGIQVQAYNGPNLVALTQTDEEGQFALSTSRLEQRLRFVKESYDTLELDGVVWNEGCGCFRLDNVDLSEVDIELSQVDNGTINVTLDIAPAWIPDDQRNASVRLVGEDFEETRGPISDGNTDSFTDLPHGTYLLIVDRPGFSNGERLVTITNQRTEVSETIGVELVDLFQARLDLVGVAVPSEDLEGINLSGADLSGANFFRQNLSGLDLSGADLSGANLQEANLIGADLQGARLTATNLRGAVLNCARADGANFFGASLEAAPGDGEDLNTQLVNTSLRFANLSSALLNSAFFSYPEGTEFICQGPDAPDPQRERLYEGTRFFQSDLTQANMTGLDLRGSVFNNALLERTDLAGANLEGVSMILTNFTETRLDSAFLNNAAMLNAIMFKTSARGTVFDGATMSSAIIEEANFGCHHDTQITTPEGCSDRLGENDTIQNAVPIEAGVYRDLGLCISFDEDDWYTIELEAGDILTLGFQFREENSLAQARLLAPDGETVLGVANHVPARTQIVWEAQEAGTHYLHVEIPFFLEGMPRENPYRLSVSIQNDDPADANICASLRGVNLNGANIVGTSFEGLDATGASMLGVIMGDVDARPPVRPDDCVMPGACEFETIEDCELPIPRACLVTQSSLKDALLEDTEMAGVFFNHVNLSGASFEASNLRDAVFSDCLLKDVSYDNAVLDGIDAIGLDLSDVTLRGASLKFAQLFRANLEGGQLQGADFEGADLRLANLEAAFMTDVNLTDARLEGANLAETRLDRVDLSDMDFQGFDMRSVVLRDANLTGTNFNGANLQVAIMNGAILSQTSFVGADLRNGSFIEATLFGVDFSEANVRSANFTDARFTFGAFTNANLSRANMTRTTLNFLDLTEADVDNVRWSDTLCPDRSNSDDNGGTCEGHLAP